MIRHLLRVLNQMLILFSRTRPTPTQLETLTVLPLRILQDKFPGSQLAGTHMELRPPLMVVLFILSIGSKMSWKRLMLTQTVAIHIASLILEHAPLVPWPTTTPLTATTPLRISWTEHPTESTLPLPFEVLRPSLWDTAPKARALELVLSRYRKMEALDVLLTSYEPQTLCLTNTMVSPRAGSLMMEMSVAMSMERSLCTSKYNRK